MSWLTALKVIPWAQVLEHGPKVVEKAKDLLNKQQASAPASSAAPPSGSSSPDEGAQVWQHLQDQLDQTREQLAALQSQSAQQAQTLAELAEQILVQLRVIQGLRRRLWALGLGVLALALAVGWMGIRVVL